MEISPVLQARLLLYSCIFGIGVGVASDLAWVLRYPLASRKRIYSVACALLDLFLMLFAGIGYVILCYYFNKGEMRAFSAFGIIFGFLVWRITLSKTVRRLLVTAFCFIIRVFRYFSSPFIRIYKYLVNKLIIIICSIRKALAKIIFLEYNNIRVKRAILKRAKRGFLGKRR